MTISVVTNPLAAYGVNDAGFREWGKAITDTLDALGLTQVYSDIDWATVSMPTTSNIAAGKRVYAINDALSSTREIYVSVEFARGVTTNTTVGYRINIVVGATHSSGTVGGIGMSNFFTMNATSPGEGEVVGVRTDAGFSLFSSIPWFANGFQFGFLVQRLARAGSPTVDGAAMMFYGTAVNSAAGTSATISRGQIVNWVAGVAYPDTGSTQWNPSSLIPLGTDASYNDTIPAVPIMTCGDFDPLTIAIAAPTPPYAASTVFSAVVNGQSGSYRIPYSGCGLDSAVSPKLRIAFRVG